MWDHARDPRRSVRGGGAAMDDTWRAAAETGAGTAGLSERDEESAERATTVRSVAHSKAYLAAVQSRTLRRDLLQHSSLFRAEGFLLRCPLGYPKHSPVIL